VLRQGRGGVEEGVQILEEGRAQLAVPLQVGDQHLEAARHVEVEG
jgi:hypothetical protein